MKKWGKRFLLFVLVGMGLCLGLAAVSALSNLSLPKGSVHPEVLDESEFARQAELVHLRRSAGDAVWPGWGAADLPVITYNEGFAFLLDYSGEPPAGWVKVPAGARRGGAWQVLSGAQFEGKPVYRQPLSAGVAPENFAVRVGNRWVSSLQTREWSRIQLAESVRADLPEFLRPVFPYRVFVNLLLSGDDQYISAAAHESFHAWQGLTAPEKFAAAEGAARLGEHYPWQDAALVDDWKKELEALKGLLDHEGADGLSGRVREFLELRAARRLSARLSPELIAYENQREWVEGLARYTELEIWRQASLPAYTPVDAALSLPDFERYRTFPARWRREVDQIPRMFNAEGDGRFYYTGMAQAILLDRLMPGWKARAFDEGVWLETLLAEAVQ